MNKTQDPKKLMEAGWKARENLEFEKAKKLLSEAKTIFENEEDWFNVTETLNHLAYTEKLEAGTHNLKGMQYAKDAEKIALEHSVKKALILRALMSLANSTGLFEQGLKWGNESLEYFTNPVVRADILSHVATFQLRTGMLVKAEGTINEAEKLMENTDNHVDEPHKSIWKTKILLTKALILYNRNSLDEAKVYVERAGEIAEEQNLKTRITESNSIRELFN